jgi:UDP-N-acetyl-D-galactosamine dehydrogenase
MGPFDLRNSKVPDIHRELRQFGIDARVHDPAASAPEALRELRKGGLLLDVKSALEPARLGAGVRYWSL